MNIWILNLRILNLWILNLQIFNIYGLNLLFCYQRCHVLIKETCKRLLILLALFLWLEYFPLKNIKFNVSLNKLFLLFLLKIILLLRHMFLVVCWILFIQSTLHSYAQDIRFNFRLLILLGFFIWFLLCCLIITFWLRFIHMFLVIVLLLHFCHILTILLFCI